ncbi:MAG: type II toxin-antitoxin system RelE/ParE family toxin [Verrucomicrobiaceae bacterium]|nr:type II toxin-antitoxin system RelE/ParE family toxin [Verrucomicrobiaceae bacterium]
MSYEIEYTRNALREAEEVIRWIRERAPRAADKWRDDLIAKVESLASRPLSHRLAPESERFARKIRQVLFHKRRGQYRILFTVDGQRVVILSIRHCFRRPLEVDDLPEF